MTDLIKKIILTAAVLFSGIAPVLAHKDTFFNSPHKLELKPAFFAEGGIQLAKSYWLGGAEIDLNFKGDDDDTICQAKGYITGACKGNETPIKYCGAGNKYHKCGCDASVYRYSVSNCVSGSLPNDDICGDYSSGCVCDGAFVWNSDSNSCDFYCSSDYDCPGQVCRTSNGDCVDCVYDSDCGSGQSCTNNKCETVDLCENVSCTGGQTCNASTGACECPSGQVLSDGRCEQANCANGGSSCSTGVCDMNSGQCVECTSDSHCSGNKECINNTCQVIDTCKNVTCTGGKTCVDGTCACPAGKIDNNGVCEGPDCSNGGVTCSGSTPQCSSSGQCVECTSDSHCSGGQQCSGNVCKCPSSKPYLSGSTCVECTSDSNCSDGKKCLSNFCQSVDACEGVSCTGGKTCVNGDCICPSGQIDNKGICEMPDCSNGGVTCTGGKTCQNKVCSCPSGQIDNNGTCEAPNCANGGVTCTGGKTCQNKVCVCPSDQVDNNGTCEAPNCANGGIICSGSTPVCAENGQCVECAQDSHCDSGEVCLNSSCVVDRDCQVGDIFYRDGVCSDIYDEKRELLAVVVDPSRRLLIFIGERPAPVSSSPSDASYQDVSTVSNEGIRDFFERGFINSRALAKSGSRQTFCLNLGSDALMNEFYTPGGGEIFILSENAAKVEETLNFLKTKNSTATGIIGSTIFTSDEYADDPTKMIAATITKAGTNFWPSFKAVDKTDVTTMLRCFARYKCKSTDAAKCKITPYAVGDDPHTSYVKASTLPGKTGCTLEAFRWNTDYKRYIVLQNGTNSSLCHSTGEGGGGTTEPTKTPCQPGDYLYATATTEPALCSASVVSSRTLLGRVLYTSGDGSGVILHHKITSNVASRNFASNSSLCSAYSLGIPNASGGSWRLADIDELGKNSNWKSYIQGSTTTYFWIKYTSLPYLFNLQGDGPLSPGSTSESRPGICTSSFGTTYRK